jgi:hypothetical protein
VASFGGSRWNARPFQWKTTGSIGVFSDGHGEVQVELRPAPEFRGWAELDFAPRGACLQAVSGEHVGRVRLSPADVRRLRDCLSKVADDSEVSAYGGRV